MDGADPNPVYHSSKELEKPEEPGDHERSKPFPGAPWVGTQLRVVAVTGLASAHTEPFVRVLFRLPRALASRKARATSRQQNVVSLDNEGVGCQRRRDSSGKYTATWDDAHGLDDKDGTFTLPPDTESVEVQAWNRFPSGFDVLLGTTTVAITSVWRQLLREQQTRYQEPPLSAAIFAAPRAWYPLLLPSSSRTGGVAAQRLQLSVQLDMRFISDPRAFAIRQEIARRTVAERLEPRGTLEALLSDLKQSGQRTPEPAFAFTKPFEAIDWSVIVSTSLRHIFFHSGVDRLSSFKHQVLYGDLLRELHEDDGLHVHDDHVAAFQLCQFSAQYLDHCVNTLAARRDEYSDQFRALTKTRRQLRAFRSQLKRQRDRLKNENNELDLLLSTYKSIADQSTTSVAPQDKEASESPALRSVSAHPSHHTSSSSSSAPPSPNAVVSQKPAFLCTWEEREHERRLEKERSKAQRIADEKSRLEQVAEDQRLQELEHQRHSSLLERGRRRAALTIQAFARRTVADRKRRQAARESKAAVQIQARVRGLLTRRAYVTLVDRHRMMFAQHCMAESERETRTLLQMELEQQEKMLANAALVLDQPLPLEAGLPATQEVSLLVSTWRKLRRIFLLARTATPSRESEGGCEYRAYEAVFAKLDARQDGVLDRAELRAGVRSFGIRIDRKLTRMLVALVRAKCSAPPKPLHISLPHFIQGFDLPCGPKKRRATTFDSPCEHVHVLHSTGGDRARTLTEPKVDTPDSSDDGEEEQAAAGATCDSASDNPIALVLKAVAAMRQQIVDAATRHMEALGTSTANYFAFRDALAFVFREFDTDGNGELDMAELVACVQSIGLELSRDNLTLVRDCFGCDSGDRIRIADFVSFVLTRTSDESAESLGLVGSHLREVVLERVRATRQELESVEDAVRRVFRRAFPSTSRRSCPVARFTKTLAGLQLRVKPVQLARLVTRLDKNNDGSISFNEFLFWLRLRAPSEFANASSSPLSSATAIDGNGPLQAQTTRQPVTCVRSLLYRLAGVDEAAPASAWRPSLLRLFREIDRNNSKKVTTDEIEGFLASRDLVDLCGADRSPLSWSTAVSDAIDVDRNGVVTVDEWLAFLAPSPRHLHQQQQVGTSQHDPTDVVVRIDGVREALRAAMEDEAALLAWFHGLPGVLTVTGMEPPSTATTTAADIDAREQHPHMKVRVGVFKTALRAKVGASTLPTQAIDKAVKRLDSDHSGWVTTAELRHWAFPYRDLEALVHAVKERWREEEQRARDPDFALTLYRRFDADGNGVLAQRELRGGFTSFGLLFTVAEVATLVQAFDRDQDGCWNKTEFLAFVYTLLPHAIFQATTSDSALDPGGAGSVDNVVDDGALTFDDALALADRVASVDSRKPPLTAAVLSTDDDEEYGSDGFLSSSRSSSGSSEHEALPSLAEPDAAEYSEDFG